MLGRGSVKGRPLGRQGGQLTWSWVSARAGLKPLLFFWLVQGSINSVMLQAWSELALWQGLGSSAAS